MKLPRANCDHHGRRQGSAVLVVLILLSIMMIFVTGELTAARLLNLDLRLIEHKQLQRIGQASPKPAPTSSAQKSNG